MWPLAAMGLTRASPTAQLDRLALFGFLLAFATLVCWVEQDRSAAMRMLLGPCQAALAVYGFLASAWPLGMVLSVVAAVTVARSWKAWTYPRRGKYRAGRAEGRMATRFITLASRRSSRGGDVFDTGAADVPFPPSEMN